MAFPLPNFPLLPNANYPVEYLISVGVAGVISDISVANGYWNTIQSTSIVQRHLNIGQDPRCDDVDAFPWVCINTGTTENSKMIGALKEGRFLMPVSLYAYHVTNIDLALTQLINDVERALENENSEGIPLKNYFPESSNQPHAVTQLNVVAKVTDEGFLAPWGTAILRVEVIYRYYPHLQKPT